LTGAVRSRYAWAMRISLSTGAFYHRGLDYSLRLARASGFDGVEYVLGPDYFLRGAAWLEGVVHATGFPVLSVHPPFSLFARLPVVPWPRRIVRSFPRVTALGRQLGAEVVVSHTVFLQSERSPRGERFLEALRLGREVGGGIAVAIESNQFNKRKRRYLLDDLARLARFAQTHGYGVTFDTCHAGANREDLLEDYALVRPVLKNVHLSDVVWRSEKAHTHLVPGEGTLPLRAFLGALAADGYDGLVTMEIHPWYVSQLSAPRAEHKLAQAVAFVREAIATPTTSGSD
jgi:sugar phosphate isomerase/epimerase